MERVTEKELWGLRAKTLCAWTWIRQKGQERESDHHQLEPVVATEEAELEGRCRIGKD
jgi:hypothetical protein